MKNHRLIILMLAITCTTAVAQHSRDAFSNAVIPPVTKEKLSAINSAYELVPRLPGHWSSIIDIVSLEVEAVNNGEEKIITGKDAELTDAQKQLLHSADLYSDIKMKIWFRWKDSTTAPCYRGIQSIGDIRYTLVPEKEAEFPGGYGNLRTYLNDNITARIQEVTKKKSISPMNASFTVNEFGKVVDINVSGKTPDPEIENLILEAIKKMPDWQPAQDTKGTRVKQEFTFTTIGGKPGKGC